MTENTRSRFGKDHGLDLHEPSREIFRRSGVLFYTRPKNITEPSAHIDDARPTFIVCDVLVIFAWTVHLAINCKRQNQNIALGQNVFPRR